MGYINAGTYLDSNQGNSNAYQLVVFPLEKLINVLKLAHCDSAVQGLTEEAALGPPHNP